MDASYLEQLREFCRDEAAFEHLKASLTAYEEGTQKKQKLLLHVISKIRESLELDDIFQTTAREVRQLLDADRVGMFRFYLDSGYDDGEFVSEDVKPDYASALAVKIHDHCFGQDYAAHYARGRVQAVADIYHAGLKTCHVEVLERFQIRANLVVPLLLGDKLWGLLCIHQCAGPRVWKGDEIEFVQQIAAQLGVALHQAELFYQTRQQSNALAEALWTLQKTQTHLLQSEKMSSLGQLVAGVAHEINNPVNFIHGNLTHATQYATELMQLLRLYQQTYPPSAAIQGYAETIELDFLLDDFPKMLSSMHLGADRIRQIVLSLRNFSRVDETGMKVADLHEGLESTLLILHYRLKARSTSPGIQVIKNYSDLPRVECHPGQVNQVFMNILSNAIDALEETNLSQEPGVITMTTTQEFSDVLGVDCAVIRLADNGPGIPEHLQSRLFDPFFTTKPLGKGTGLGLSISHQIIVERHQGVLRCLSVPGQGTEFRIELPLVSKVTDANELTGLPLRA